MAHRSYAKVQNPDQSRHLQKLMKEQVKAHYGFVTTAGGPTPEVVATELRAAYARETTRGEGEEGEGHAEGEVLGESGVAPAAFAPVMGSATAMSPEPGASVVTEMDKTRQWLSEERLAKLIPVFEENEVGLEEIVELSAEELEEFINELPHSIFLKKRLRKAVAALHTTVSKPKSETEQKESGDEQEDISAPKKASAALGGTSASLRSATTKPKAKSKTKPTAKSELIVAKTELPKAMKEPTPVATASIVSMKAIEQKESAEEHTAVAKMDDSAPKKTSAALGGISASLRSAATEPKATPKTIVAKCKVPKKKKGPMAAAMTVTASVESTIDGAIKFKFDVGNANVYAKPGKYQVSKDLLTATKKLGSGFHIWLKPSIHSGIHSLQLRVGKRTGSIAVAVVDNWHFPLYKGCCFYDRGDVWMDDRRVAESQSFGRSVGFEKDDVVTLTIDMESFKVTIKSPYGSYEQKWQPRSTAHVAVEMRGIGTSLSIVN